MLFIVYCAFADFMYRLLDPKTREVVAAVAADFKRLKEDEEIPRPLKALVEEVTQTTETTGTRTRKKTNHVTNHNSVPNQHLLRRRNVHHQRAMCSAHWMPWTRMMKVAAPVEALPPLLALVTPPLRLVLLLLSALLSWSPEQMHS